MNPKAVYSRAERRAPSAGRREKLSKQTAPRKSEKKFSRTNSITDGGCRFGKGFPKERKILQTWEGVLSSTGKIKYTKAVNDFGLVIKSCQSKLTMKRYEKHSKRQGARANHPKQTALPECHAPRADYPTRAPKADCPIWAPSAERPFFQSKQFLGGFITTRQNVAAQKKQNILPCRITLSSFCPTATFLVSEIQGRLSIGDGSTFCRYQESFDILFGIIYMEK